MAVIQKRDDSFIRNFVFGVEDSLTSTVGLLSGIAAAGVFRKDIIVTGVVLILVEAFSMAVGSFLSEQSAESYIEGKDAPFKKALYSSVVMFFSYFFSGFIPLAPYFFIKGIFAIVASIVLSLFSLFVLGMLSGRFSKTNIIKEGFRMLVLGGAAILIGVLVGILIG